MPFRRVHGAFAAVALALFNHFGAGVAWPQVVDPKFDETNGSVAAVAVSGGNVYLGGSFDNVEHRTGRAAVMDLATGSTLDPLPFVVGNSVKALAPDDNGGRYIGGEFLSVLGVRRDNLAHVDANGQMSNWGPRIAGTVRTLLVSGGTIYVGGTFTAINGATHRHLAAIDRSTGAVRDWPEANGPVYALAVLGPTLYVGGGFSAV